MTRISVFQLVVLLPFLGALLFAARHAYVLHRQAGAMSILKRSLANGESLPYSRLMIDFGRPKARQHIARAAASELIEFDGDSRVIQIRKDGYEYPEGTLDLLELHDFSDHCSTAIHQPPVGTRIKTVAFVGDGIDISLYGNLRVDGTVITIPEKAPETYHLRWRKGFPPSSPPLTQLIKTRQRP